MTWLQEDSESVECDAMPDRVAYAVRLTLLAKTMKARHLPHFESLEQSDDLLQLKIKKPRLTLYEAMDHPGLVEEHGHMLIKGLLTMLLELRQAKATLHNVTPDGIFVNSQGSKLVVADLFQVTYSDLRVLGKPRGLMPYSNHGLREHELTGYHNQERTMWSIGMIILELFVGTAVVRCLRTHHDVVDLVTHVSYSLGQRVYDLIRGLLFRVSFNII